MVVVSLFVLLGSRSLRGAKKHPTAAILDNSVSIRVPARIPLVSKGRKRDRVELGLVLELTRSRELLCGFGASSYPSSRSFEFEFDEAAGLRVRVFTEFLWKR